MTRSRLPSPPLETGSSLLLPRPTFTPLRLLANRTSILVDFSLTQAGSPNLMLTIQGLSERHRFTQLRR